ncbi:MAG TPA: serine hydrolase domain-containing protein [Polyangiaceae bacterium]|nr:serine hydrolase domain-containing protein [Polyangiaceae bacterium]
MLKRWVVEQGVAPGASAYVARHVEGSWRAAQGAAGRHAGPGSTLVSPQTIYDLASLTKPVAAATVARLARAGALGWGQPLGAILPEVAATASAGTPLELLASHRAGLEAHIRLRDSGAPVSSWLSLCANARRAECRTAVPPEGFAPVYSDLGYILLGAALEAHLGLPLDRLLEREVAGPLGLELDSAQGWGRRIGPGDFLERVAPTEHLAERGGLVCGVVHDDNAWDSQVAGAAGHAGLFGTAEAIGGFARALLDALAGRSAAWLARPEAEFLVSPRPGGSLRTGFDGKAEQGSSAGPCFGVRAFGHLGFTGTSVWCDPDAGVVVVLLTNRVHPTRENILIRTVRPDVHGALFGLSAGL